LQDNAISTRSTLFLLMANILNGMTHLSIDIQLMAFRFLELVVLNFPSSFSSYAEQAFNNFIAVLSNDRINLHDRNKLNSVLSGLGHCLSLVAKTIENDDISNRQVCTMSSWNCHLFKKFLPDITLLKSIFNYTPLLKAVFITYRFMTSLQGNFGNVPLMKITQ